MTRTTADSLRDAFDGEFARPRSDARHELIDLLGIVLAGDPHAIRLSAIAGVHADRPITPVPSPRRALLGVAGFRGALMPVFDLAMLIGYPAAAKPRWLCRVERASDAACFAFDAVLGHRRAAASAFAERQAPCVRQVVEVDGHVWPVIDVEALWQLAGRKE